ncbi:MAG TPA: outer membrane beta-barrel protein [Thermoanaerobaculia bacterium]|nr:outer membrane beta-barrel protein [Thermoanaerobaculia bacterium]
MKPRTFFLPLLMLLAFAPVCFAQIRAGTVEINPFGGYFFGGRFPAGSNGLFTSKVDIDDHATYGGRIGWNITSLFEAEAQFSRTDTHFVSPGGDVLFGSAGTRLGDLTIDYTLGYVTFNFGHRRVVPYVTFGMGAARLDPDVCRVRPSPCSNPGTDWRYTASAGGGIKTFVTPHFGFRLDGRYYGTLLRSDDCDSTRGCDRNHDHNRNDWLSNGDINGGLIFAF